MQITPETIVVGALLALQAADRVTGQLRRVGRVPRLLQRWDHERAQEIVAEDARTEALHRLAAIEGQIQCVVSEFKPNGGSSAKDALTRIERKVDDHIAAATVDSARLYDHINAAGAHREPPQELHERLADERPQGWGGG